MYVYYCGWHQRSRSSSERRSDMCLCFVCWRGLRDLLSQYRAYTLFTPLSSIQMTAVSDVNIACPRFFPTDADMLQSSKRPLNSIYDECNTGGLFVRFTCCVNNGVSFQGSASFQSFFWVPALLFPGEVVYGVCFHAERRSTYIHMHTRMYNAADGSMARAD